ncbi:type VI secretion system protein ImpL [Methylobacterium sp. BE186]|uniref:type VI secretion system membrane subunit TssM n=1 Tax=Methylobacterium sp. BE186 TaxID=2817715 RepID=UPI002859A9BB|nr:type VI secretion system membrane subunit TssM [Methylobacterium sp. BE186]MDR7040143.1 type VI secretion system protein ImpL [Methylobacterium sp. BE186]
MSLAAWLRLAATAIGALALCALFWWAGPLVAVGDVRPLEPVWARAILCLAILLGAGGYVGWELYKRRKAIRALESEVAAGDEAENDGTVLQASMRDALATLRKVRGAKGDHLYELPWYVIIGPPGSGKTTALVNSGLKFPLSRGATPEAVAGAGGTRYCDWWFTDDAVLIDTAGRYTTQDSDPRSDRQSWTAFLDILKKYRPRQPVNGVIVAISLEDLLRGGEAEVVAHANAVRKRLLELNERLGIDFPVYVVFTKADLLAGFTDFFAHLPEIDRRMVWGHTFQTDEKTRNMIGDVPAEFDALVERLNEWLPDRLQEEPNPTARVVLFGFPSQLASTKAHVVDFLNRVFEPSRYHVNATLRGFYFTSGTQNGTPIDQLIGSLSRSFGSEDVGAGAYSGQGRSYFLTDLLKTVIIGEAGWVSTDRAAVRRSNLTRLAAYGGLALASALLVGLWWTSYLRNSQLVQQSNVLLAKYQGEAAEILREPVVADRNLARVVPLLNTLRYMPAGYAFREESAPTLATFGLSQRERLNSAALTAYHTGLERLLRPRLIFRLEEQLEANRNNPGFLYEALKVYLMVGGRPEAPPDRDLVLAWMRRDWAENLFPGAGYAKGRELLEEHLRAMLDLEDGTPLLVSVNQSLVDDCQRALARLSIAERAYELLKSDARAASQRDWTALRAGGPDTSLVFEVVGGGDLDRVRVPFFFTYDGFFEAFIDRFGDVAEAADRDRWVLGPSGEQQAYTAQYGSLFADLLKLYARDFVPAWKQALAKLKMRALLSDKPRYLALQAVAAPTSPLRQMLESLRDETQLTRERPADKGKDGDGRAGRAKAIAGKAAADAAERAVTDRLPSGLASTATALGRLGMEGRGGGRDRFAVPTNEAPGANIEAAFRPFHVLLDGEAGRRATDQLIANLNEIKNAALSALNPAEAAQANIALVTQARSLRALAARFPPPFEPMIRGIANEFEGSATGAAVSQVAQSLGDQVIRDCQQIVTNRYPFVRTSDRETPIADFARLFGPGGILDRFFTQNLAARADRSRPQWVWRQDDQVARSFSAATLREFQRAAEIRDAFFPTGGNMPAFAFAVTPLTLSADVQKARLDVNGTALETQQGVNAPVTMQWPGPAGLGRTAITLDFGYNTQPIVMEKTGAWSLFRALDTGSVLKQGDNIVATFVIGGRQLSYQINVSSLLNPFALPALREFRCPSGI